MPLSYDDYVICNEDFENYIINDKILGFKMKIRINSYRGNYLSCIENLSIKVDGEPINKEHIIFCINGKRFCLHQLPELYSEYWFVLDKAELIIYKNNGLEIGEHEVEVTLAQRFAYSSYFGKYKTHSSTTRKKLLIKQ